MQLAVGLVTWIQQCSFVCDCVLYVSDVGAKQFYSLLLPINIFAEVVHQSMLDEPRTSWLSRSCSSIPEMTSNTWPKSLS